jgi:hypothetical protein
VNGTDAMLHYRWTFYTFQQEWVSPVLISIFCVYSVGLAILVIVRRNYYPLKARNLVNTLGLMITHPLGQASLLFPYALPCALYHLGLACITVASFVFVATRLLHFYFLYTCYNQKQGFFKGKDQDATVRKMRIFKFLTSGIFYAGAIAIIVIVGVLNVVISTAASGANIWRSSDSCAASMPVSYVLIGVGVFICVVCVILFFCTIRIPDIFGIRREFIFDVVIAIGVIIFTVIALVVNLNKLERDTWSLRIGFYLYGLAALTNSGLVPALRTFWWSRKVKVATQQNFEELLKNARFLEVFKKYCKQELALENMLFYEEVLNFKKESGEKQKELAKQICRSFLNNTSIMELNVNLQHRQQAVQKVHSDAFDSEVFDTLLTEIKLLMTDTFSRFKHTHAFKEFDKKETAVVHSVN